MGGPSSDVDSLTRLVQKLGLVILLLLNATKTE